MSERGVSVVFSIAVMGRIFFRNSPNVTAYYIGLPMLLFAPITYFWPCAITVTLSVLVSPSVYYLSLNFIILHQDVYPH